jgi:predicted MPP superfamily phosphohydrolase
MQQLIGWLLLILSVAGHTEWWVMAVNRTHSLPIRTDRLRSFRSLHDIAVLGYPFLLLWLTGFGESSLLRGGQFFEQPQAVRMLLWVTIAGCVPLVLGILRWHFIRHSEFHKADRRERYNVVEQAKTDAELKDIKGPRRHLSQWWPCNEIYHLEVNTKSIRVAEPGAGKDSSRAPIRIVHFSDLHVIGCPGEQFYRFMVTKAASLRADAYVFTGDLIDSMELLPAAIDILRPLAKVAPCFFILGNHDWTFDFEFIRSELSAAGWKCVTGLAEIITLKGQQVLVAGSEQPWMGELPPIVSDAGCDVRILLSHSPDQWRFARRWGYDLMLSGHTHGGQVVLPLIGPVYSPSLYGVSFVSGLFQLGKLSMHVSRGIGAKDPMRWRCCPELTCLEVHC